MVLAPVPVVPDAPLVDGVVLDDMPLLDDGAWLELPIDEEPELPDVSAAPEELLLLPLIGDFELEPAPDVSGVADCA